MLIWTHQHPCTAAGYIFVVVQQLGEALCHWCLYTHTRWISTNQILYTFFVLKIFYIEFAFGLFFVFFRNVRSITFGLVIVLLSMLYYNWEMVAI